MHSKLLFLLLLLSFGSQGQQQYFNKRLDFNACSYENGFDILPYDQGYISCLSSTISDTSSQIKILICFLDSICNLLQTKTYSNASGNIYAGGQGKICKTLENGYALASSIAYSQTDANVVLYKFNHYGDTLWTKEYGDTSFQSGWQCKQTRDKGFIITGQTLTYSPYGDILLIKTDSNGVKQWEHHFGGIDQDLGFSVDTCYDGGFIIGGFTWSYGPNSLTDFANAYLVKTDSMGNFEWQRVFGGNFYDAFWHVIQTKDSGIVAGGYYTNYDASAHCCGGYGKPYLVKLDLTGNLLWEKTYGDSVFDTGLVTIDELPNGDVLGGGITHDQKYKGLLLRVNSDGDSLLYKKYFALTTSSSCFFYDVSLDKDDGYICTGYVTPALPDTGTQDIWVLKLDSNGCEISNCLSSDIALPEFAGPHMSLYPNPACSIVSVNIQSFDPLHNPQLKVFDVMGKELINRNVDASGKLIYQSFSISSLSSGIYFVSLFDNDECLSTIRLLKYDQ
ncbi:MAG: T9SS type A sorting domain-containing protein [Bacteroidota bacterium]